MAQPQSGKTPSASTDQNSIYSILSSSKEAGHPYVDHLIQQIDRLAEIGRALSGEHDLNTLLEKICDEARKFTDADACTLYIVHKDQLHFRIVQNHTMEIRMGGKTGEEIKLPPIDLVESNVSAYVAIKGVSINIPDVYDTDLFDFTGPKEFDKATGYRSTSMLLCPMRNHENDIIGVLQLVNARNPDTGATIPFSPDFVSLTESLASQAAVSITNARLINDMEHLFESFVEVMATAIDEKSPITGGHIRRVANLTMVMAEELHKTDDLPFKEVHFTPEKFHELRVASWMHDIGKVTTPVEIIEKSKKLETIFDRSHLVDMRMQFIIQKTQLEAAEAQLKLAELGEGPDKVESLKDETEHTIRELREIREFIQKCNEPSEFLEDEKLERLKKISQKTYMDENGNEQPFITPDELENLSIRRGSINEKERQIMKNHAQITLDMLYKIPFTKKLKNIPNFAGAHHECINGKGYPLGLQGDEIPFEGKLMAVTDITEALTAQDRPYKKAMPLDQVYAILRSMVKRNELDHDLVEFFINKNVYEIYQAKHETPTSTQPPEVSSKKKKDP
ncbi:MAG: GAF domain-containing protein [Nitrospinota bacterium]|nr:GAF domain-containing protein [Nitrospinota bacterium]